MPPHKRRAEFIKLGLGLSIVAVIVLTLAGKMHWIGAALTGLLVAARSLLPTLIRLFPMLSSALGNRTSAGAGQTSTVTTELLRMTLDHDSGALAGEVLRGPFRDWRLEELSREQLQQLMQYCMSEDADSVQLLESYLQQRFPGASDFDTDEAPPASSGSGMSRQEALAVLGLEEGAGDEDIVASHRTLMQKLHPDRGGNDYLAAKVNQAKDLLLG
ncbi:MAG: molecular chaperone DnaJ [Halioglobus sp.]